MYAQKQTEIKIKCAAGQPVTKQNCMMPLGFSRGKKNTEINESELCTAQQYNCTKFNCGIFLNINKFCK